MDAPAGAAVTKGRSCGHAFSFGLGSDSVRPVKKTRPPPSRRNGRDSDVGGWAIALIIKPVPQRVGGEDDRTRPADLSLSAKGH